jgi:hypothetical protein
MHEHHPATLALNAGPIADVGYLKDLPEILHRIVNDDRRLGQSWSSGGSALIKIRLTVQ